MKRTALALALIFVLSVCIFYGLCFHSVEADATATIYIRTDGSIEGTNKIQRDRDIYTLTANISGGIQVQKSNIVIDGAGYAVEGNGEYGRGIDLSNGISQDPSRSSITNVTLKNLKIINCYYAIGSENTHNNTFIGNYIADCDTGFWITGSSNNTLFHNTVKDCITGISINYGSGGNVITENNVMSSFSVWLSPEPVVDRNYWSDYLTRYPNATEIDNSGIWNTPYDREAFADNHPLVKPISNQWQPTDSQQTPFPTVPVAASAAAIIVVAGLLVYLKKRHPKLGGTT